MQAIAQLQKQLGTSNTSWAQSALPTLLGPNANTRSTITLSASDLENAIGGPAIGAFYAAIEDMGGSGSTSPNETYANENLGGVVLPPQAYPVPAIQIAPVLRYQEILEIEKSAQHIVHNTTEYSKALWLSLTAEERAIILDGYTIGVPTGGVSDPSEMIPLLNCVQNRILGTFGNCLMMPFMIPQAAAEAMNPPLDPAATVQSLLAYQKASFVSPHSTVALPTRGVLGEAVLGHCPSAEKIDLTRFWNWQDAPSDTAPGIGMVQLPTTTPPLTTGVTAPNSLTNLAPLINNLITAPQPNTDLLRAMGQAAASQQDFSPTLTGQQQLAQLMQNGQSLANQARQDALKTTQTLTSQALATVGNIVGSAYGNSTAGSSAAAAANGTAQPPLGNNANTQAASNPASSSGNVPTPKATPTPTPKATPTATPAAAPGATPTPGAAPSATPAATPASTPPVGDFPTTGASDSAVADMGAGDMAGAGAGDAAAGLGDDAAIAALFA
jgi:hypothetical protein